MPQANRLREIRIELNKQRCIGNGACQKIYPKRFKVMGESAELINGITKNELSQLQVHCNEAELKKFISAGEMCPVNAIRIIDIKDNTELVSAEIQTDNLELINAHYDDLKEFVMDPRGYFLIAVDRKNKTIEVGFCSQLNKISIKITGKKPLEIYQTIIKKGLLSRLDHAAYLGREIQKAYIALQERIVYVQDDELDFNLK